ncbi:MAG: 2-hydroxyacyl-CoA dehydratase family protein [Oricola sp.]
MEAQQARAALNAAFAERRVPGDGAPSGNRLVGVFGNGLPAPLLAAMSLVPVDVKMAPESALSVRAPAIGDYIEPFVDDYARIFLHRLFSGAFDDLRAIVFCRDDAAALVAYQYALELRRQGVAQAPAPHLVLWNFVHRTTGPAHAFNRRQVERLIVDLAAGLTMDDLESRLPHAVRDEAERAAALSGLDTLRKARGGSIAAVDAFRWRNAGRSLESADHARLLRLALEPAGGEARPSAPRIALIGSALDSLSFYETLDGIGAIVTDLQPFGEVWPGPPGGETLDDLLAAVAADRFCPRTEPATLHREAIVRRCVEDRCDLVIAQLDQNDDSVGWDLPSLRRSLAEHGIPLVELGFRDHRPDGAWLASARARVLAQIKEPA